MVALPLVILTAYASWEYIATTTVVDAAEVIVENDAMEGAGRREKMSASERHTAPMTTRIANLGTEQASPISHPFTRRDRGAKSVRACFPRTADVR